MTPILAAGFTNVASTYDVAVSKVSLTTGLYMMGLGVGSVFASPTAILYGKRPVYLFGAIMFIATSCWCAASPSYVSLLVARIFQGISISPVECLPSATIAEIFFLHERVSFPSVIVPPHMLITLEGIPHRCLYASSARREKFGSTCQRCRDPKLGVALGLLVSLLFFLASLVVGTRSFGVPVEVSH